MADPATSRGSSGERDAPELSGARLWAAFRGCPRVLQLTGWLVAWPVLIALLLVSPPRPDALRALGAVAALLIGLPLWLTFVDATFGFELLGGTGGATS